MHAQFLYPHSIPRTKKNIVIDFLSMVLETRPNHRRNARSVALSSRLGSFARSKCHKSGEISSV
jgi:hypothetical protein